MLHRLIEPSATRPKDGRLFSDEETTDRFGRAVSQWFSRELTALDVKDRKKKGLHSFRHTMIDRLRAAKVD